MKCPQGGASCYASSAVCVPDMACRSASRVKIIHLSPREGEGGVGGVSRRVKRLPLIYRKEVTARGSPRGGIEKKTALSD